MVRTRVSCAPMPRTASADRPAVTRNCRRVALNMPGLYSDRQPLSPAILRHRMRLLTTAGLAILFLNSVPVHMAGQTGGSLGLTIKEAAGIRRTEYPVS